MHCTERFVMEGDRVVDRTTGKYYVAVERLNEKIEQVALAIDAFEYDDNVPTVTSKAVRGLKESV
jgi:hypothetical protein